ncbi:hypothetical protein [Nitrospirillum pindoramense]|uniref:Methyltransferase family protein n=1 Tax=Nitrospirillum amazonense TaxID=28077 RepID=A0A560GTU9_9PROT|nr:hypothetical protein [Nitrospirillum amazonense]TWB36860.1 hypothetical protein FBZ90_11683 [Nitrospirillum amazonense]
MIQPQVIDGDWHALREPLDDKARAIELAWEFARMVPSRPHILDLGAGLGANVRHLLPRLGRMIQDWTLMDTDADLLAGVSDRMQRWAHESGWRMARNAVDGAVAELVLFGDDLRSRLTLIRQDMSTDLHDLGIQRHDGVAGNAFFDRVSAEWLDHFITELIASGLPPVLATGVQDGRLTWTPEDPDDGLVVALAQESANRDHGFGPPLGDQASSALVTKLEAAGYRLDGARSDWRLSGLRGRQAQLHLVSMLAAQAAARDPAAADRIGAWGERRRAAVLRAEMTVGHADILARR